MKETVKQKSYKIFLFFILLILSNIGIYLAWSFIIWDYHIFKWDVFTDPINGTDKRCMLLVIEVFIIFCNLQFLKL